METLEENNPHVQPIRRRLASGLTMQMQQARSWQLQSGESVRLGYAGPCRERPAASSRSIHAMPTFPSARIDFPSRGSRLVPRHSSGHPTPCRPLPGSDRTPTARRHRIGVRISSLNIEHNSLARENAVEHGSSSCRVTLAFWEIRPSSFCCAGVGGRLTFHARGQPFEQKRCNSGSGKLRSHECRDIKGPHTSKCIGQ